MLSQWQALQNTFPASLSFSLQNCHQVLLTDKFLRDTGPGLSVVQENPPHIKSSSQAVLNYSASVLNFFCTVLNISVPQLLKAWEGLNAGERDVKQYGEKQHDSITKLGKIIKTLVCGH